VAARDSGECDEISAMYADHYKMKLPP
jgi:hypothetical protein